MLIDNAASDRRLPAGCFFGTIAPQSKKQKRPAGCRRSGGSRALHAKRDAFAAADTERRHAALGAARFHGCDQRHQNARA